MTVIIGILGIFVVILTFVAFCYVFSDSFLNPKTKSNNNARYYKSGNRIKYNE